MQSGTHHMEGNLLQYLICINFSLKVQDINSPTAVILLHQFPQLKHYFMHLLSFTTAGQLFRFMQNDYIIQVRCCHSRLYLYTTCNKLSHWCIFGLQ